MRTAPLLAVGLLLTSAISGCSNDDEPQASRSTPRAALVSPTAASTGSATASASSSASSSPTTTAAQAGSTVPTPTSTPPAPGSAAPDAAPPATTERTRLTGDGVALPGQVLAFGTPFDEARPALEAALGAPSADTGVTDSFGPYGTCPGTELRALEYGGGALQLLFGDVDGGALTLYQWALTGDGSPSSVPRASALVGDAATFEFGVGTTVAQLQDEAAPATVELSPGDEAFPASFRLQDQSSGFFGYLTGTAPSDTATFVQGGQGCGE